MWKGVMMSKLKRIVSLFLCCALLASTCVVAANAADGTTEPDTAETVTYGSSETDYPIIFVTGIGQSYSYLYANEEDAQADIAANETDRAVAKWNLFCNDFSFAFKEIGTYTAILPIVSGFLASALTGMNLIPRKSVDKLIKILFRYNTVDENGQLPPVVVTPRCPYPVSQYTEEQRDNFYRTIPCQDVIGNIGEDMLYCFNYSAFSDTYQNSDGLNDFINNAVLPQTGKDKVVLIPMSMGASVVSAYLQDYGTQGKVARVVSIVGAWDGSDVFADLIELKYASDAPEKLYNGIVSDLIGEPWGYLVNVILRIFPKKTLRSIIDEILDALVENLVIKTPSLCALIPSARYDAIYDARLKGRDDLSYVTKTTEKYHQAQLGLAERVSSLNSSCGVDFFYIAGFGLEFGEFSSDYQFFQFLESAETTNSDEIIQISSTVPGSVFVHAGEEFDADYVSSHDADYMTPDKSVDISGAFFPDRVWLFYGQKHELENNNTALKLALSLATGDITGTDDPDNIFPRYNESRDLKRLKRNYIPDLEAWLENNTPTAEQQALIDEKTAAVNEMMDSVINHREADDKVIDDYYDMLVTLGVYDAPQEDKDDMSTKVLKRLNDRVYEIFGAKGFIDIIFNR